MKATVKTTVKTTVSVLAAMTFVVACGSKKSQPAPAGEGTVAPNAAEALVGKSFVGESVSCTDAEQEISANSFAGSILKFKKVGDGFQYELTQTANGPAMTEIGDLDAEGPVGVMVYKKKVYPDNGNDAVLSEKPEDTRVVKFELKDDTLTTVGYEKSICETSQTKKVYKLQKSEEGTTAPVAQPAPAAPAAPAQTGAETQPPVTEQAPAQAQK